MKKEKIMFELWSRRHVAEYIGKSIGSVVLYEKGKGVVHPLPIFGMIERPERSTPVFLPSEVEEWTRVEFGIDDTD